LVSRRSPKGLYGAPAIHPVWHNKTDEWGCTRDATSMEAVESEAAQA
jgi:hypothetical protein